MVFRGQRLFMRAVAVPVPGLHIMFQLVLEELAAVVEAVTAAAAARDKTLLQTLAAVAGVLVVPKPGPLVLVELVAQES